MTRAVESTIREIADFEREHSWFRSHLEKMMKEVELYTDGACQGNPGPGGYGAILRYGKHEKELSGGFRLTTNNRMEIMAVIIGLETLKTPCSVTIYSDSRYVVDAITKGWVRRWKAKSWMRNKDEKAVNPDLWERLLTLCDRHTVTFVWVRGHAGHPMNERCDLLATSAASRSSLPVDAGYVPQTTTKAAGGPSKITAEGQPCRKCSTPVIRRIPKKRDPSKSYWYEYYFVCPVCKTMYMVDEAKRYPGGKQP